jgi:hypothetical protein
VTAIEASDTRDALRVLRVLRGEKQFSAFSAVKAFSYGQLKMLVGIALSRFRATSAGSFQNIRVKL